MGNSLIIKGADFSGVSAGNTHLFSNILPLVINHAYAVISTQTESQLVFTRSNNAVDNFYIKLLGSALFINVSLNDRWRVRGKFTSTGNGQILVGTYVSNAAQSKPEIQLVPYEAGVEQEFDVEIKSINSYDVTNNVVLFIGQKSSIFSSSPQTYTFTKLEVYRV